MATAPAAPIYRGQGTSLFRTDAGSRIVARGQEVPYDVNGAPNDTSLFAAANPFDFGALGDGTTDDAAALLAALESGDEIDGLGKTYALSAQINPTSLVGLRNARLKWVSTSAMTVQQYLLRIEELNNWFIDNVWFDLGTVADTGQYDDSSRGGLSVGVQTAHEGLGYFCTQVALKNLRCTGSGNGTAFDVRYCDRLQVSDLMVYQRRVAYGSGPPNDDQDGLGISYCNNFTVDRVMVYDCLSQFNGNYTNYRGRGVVVQGATNGEFNLIHVDSVSQGIDLSGAGGNRNLILSNSQFNECFEWGVKIVHGIRDLTVTNVRSKGFGDAGFVFVTDPSTTGEAATSYVHLSNCHALDPQTQPYEGTGTSPYNVPVTSKLGYRFLDGGGGSLPHDIVLDNCTARDTTGLMVVGFDSEVTLPSSIIFRNCQGTGTASGFLEYNSNVPTANWRTL
jgi:hypothetical protein